MSSGSWRQADVGCPFYKSDNGKNQINCEGMNNARTLSLVYCKKCDYISQIEMFCCDGYQKCNVYKLLMSKYETSD